MAGRDAWSHAYQSGEIKNITQEQAIEYLVSRHIAKADAQELVKASIGLSPDTMSFKDSCSCSGG